MKVTAVVSTKGGPGKTTVGVNLGAFCVDEPKSYTLTIGLPRGGYVTFRWCWLWESPSRDGSVLLAPLLILVELNLMGRRKMENM
ncbi:ParA family protein [Pseudomonas rhodesiae]|jgi:hypothetical protein|uniref:ParA family protein n=1 Tax=Pseudomonas rhodesiae TaxID=76760 RepID=UPI0039C9121B